MEQYILRNNNMKQRVYCLSYCLKFLHQIFNVPALLLEDVLLKCLVTEVVSLSIVALKTLIFHKVV